MVLDYEHYLQRTITTVRIIFQTTVSTHRLPRAPIIIMDLPGFGRLAIFSELERDLVLTFALTRLLLTTIIFSLHLGWDFPSYRMITEPNARDLVLSKRGLPLRLSISLLNFAKNNRFLSTFTNQKHICCYCSIK